jgi:hypothetical protein
MNRAERRSRSKKEIQDGKVFQNCVLKTSEVLGQKFKQEPEKIVKWLYENNAHFGGTCPAAYMHLNPSKYLTILDSIK